MDKSIFSYRDYKSYLKDRIRHEPRDGRGFRQKMAQAMNCQPAYVSHVLGGDRHLSVEQAIALTEFLSLNKQEKEFFLFLVEHKRAGTVNARKFFKDLIDERRNEYLKFRQRVDIKEDLDDTAKSIYYSSSLYATVHMIVTIPEYSTIPRIAERLQLPEIKITEAVHFLKSKGLITEDKGRLVPTSKFLFLEKNSPFIQQHHNNWRMQALQSVARGKDENMHLSIALTLSHKDRDKLKQMLAEFIEDVSKTIKDSKEEELMALNLDFFEV